MLVALLDASVDESEAVHDGHCAGLHRPRLLVLASHHVVMQSCLGVLETFGVDDGEVLALHLPRPFHASIPSATMTAPQTRQGNAAGMARQAVTMYAPTVRPSPRQASA
jgi:hypothetical protein